MKEQNDMKDWKENCCWSHFWTDCGQLAWVGGTSPLFLLQQEATGSAFWSQHVLSLYWDSNNQKLQIFIKLQPPEPLILPALLRACTSPSAFIDHASILFSKIQVWRKPLLSTGNPDSIKKLRQFLIFYLVPCSLFLVFRFIYSCF